MFLIKNNLNNLPKSTEKKEALQEVESIVEQVSYVDKIVSDLTGLCAPVEVGNCGSEPKNVNRNTLSTLIFQRVGSSNIF
jgi:hypothetical protein